MGRAGSLVFGLGLLIGLALLIWQGGLTAWSGAALIAAGLGLVVWIVAAPDDLRRTLGGRAARYASGGVIATVVLVVGVAALYASVAAQQIAVDFTLPQNFTLSPPTLDILARLDRPVQLTGFYTSAALPQRDRDATVFHLFEAAAPDLIRVVYVDPTQQRVLAERFGLTQDGSAFLTYVDAATGEPDLRLIEPLTLGVAPERAVANALLSLMASGQFKVYFTTGHGEIDTTDTSAEGLAFAYGGLAQAGIQAATLDSLTLAQDGVPADASAVMIAGAREAFTADEVAAMSAYMADGGKLWVAANAPLSPDAAPLAAADPLAAYLHDTWGLRLDDDLVVDETRSFQSPTNVIPDQVIASPVTERLTDSENVVLLGARSVAVLVPETAAQNLPGRSPLLVTSDAAYGESDLASLWQTGVFARDAQDLSGPLVLAAVGEDSATGARLLLTGDADFMRNEPIGYGGNRYFYTDGLAWLMEYFERVEIDPVNDTTRLPVFVPDATLTLIFVVTVGVIPGLVLLSGALVLRRRQRR